MAMRSKESRLQSEARQKEKEEEKEEIYKRDHNACMLQLTNDTWPCDDHEPCHGWQNILSSVSACLRCRQTGQVPHTKRLAHELRF